MRRQSRVPSPPLWATNEQAWNQQWLDLRARNPAASFSWYRVENQSAYDIALPALRAMTQAHCAFCDAFPVQGVSNETIEHFRPKGDERFAGEAYAWGNLYYCCDACQAAKLSRWEDSLLRPDDEEYHHGRYFEFSFLTGQMKPNSVAAIEDRQRAEVTIRLYDLDSPERRRFRRLELRKWQRMQGMPLDDFAYRDFLDG